MADSLVGNSNFTSDIVSLEVSHPVKKLMPVSMVSNFKIWFDSSQVSILIQGAPDLYEYGLQGGSGLMVRSHAADKIPAYVENTSQPWQEGMSFNFVNIHFFYGTP